RKVVEVELGRGRQLFVDDLVAEIDALVADVDAGAGDQLLHLPLALAAEAAEKLLVAVGCARHLSLLPRNRRFVYALIGARSPGRRCRTARLPRPSCSSRAPCPSRSCRLAGSCGGR